MQRLIAFSLSFFVVALSFYILWVGKSIFIPFVVALAIGYIIIALVEWIQNLSFRGSHFPKPVAYMFALLILGALFTVFLNMLIVNVTALVQMAPEYQQKFIHFSKKIIDLLPMTKDVNFSRLFEGIDFVSWGSSILFMLTDFASSFGLILIYIIFILIEHTHLNDKIFALFKEEKSRDTTLRILTRVSRQIQSYVRIKTLISFITAFLCWAVLEYIGVDFAVFWAFLIFVLNYIPTIGSIVATIFPCLQALIQFDSLIPFVEVTVILISIHFVVGNLIEARAMGRSFNLSGIVILLSLATFGALWGIVGMFLSIPIMVIATIVFANFETTRPLAILLSQDGNIE